MHTMALPGAEGARPLMLISVTEKPFGAQCRHQLATVSSS
jgi:hypothetical protein